MSEKPRKFDGITEEGFAYTLRTFDKEPHSAESNCEYGILNNGARVPFRGHGVLERVELRDRNHFVGTMEDPIRIEAGGECRIFFNDYQVYRIRYMDITVAIAKLPDVLQRLRQFPIRLSSREHIESGFTNRPVYYREMEAIVTDFDGTQGSVKLIPDLLWGKFVAEPWLVDASPRKEHDGHDWVLEDILSPRIWWFREP